MPTGHVFLLQFAGSLQRFGCCRQCHPAPVRRGLHGQALRGEIGIRKAPRAGGTSSPKATKRMGDVVISNQTGQSKFERRVKQTVLKIVKGKTQ